MQFSCHLNTDKRHPGQFTKKEGKVDDLGYFVFKGMRAVKVKQNQKKKLFLEYTNLAHPHPRKYSIIFQCIILNVF